MALNISNGGNHNGQNTSAAAAGGGSGEDGRDSQLAANQPAGGGDERGEIGDNARWYQTPYACLSYVRGIWGDRHQTPYAYISYVLVICLFYHGLLCVLSWWITLGLSQETQQKWGRWIWAAVWMISIPLLVLPYLRFYGYARTIAAAAAAARRAENPAANEQNDEYRFSAVNANALMMHVSGAARIVYMVVGTS